MTRGGPSSTHGTRTHSAITPHSEHGYTMPPGPIGLRRYYWKKFLYTNWENSPVRNTSNPTSQHFEVAAEINAYNDRKKSVFLAASLREEAVTLVQKGPYNLAKATNVVCRNWR